MDSDGAARRWADVWSTAWPAKDVEAIVSLYAAEVLYRAFAFREPDRGIDGVRRYLTENFDVEEEIECRFGEPFVGGDRATVEWWASWVEGGQPLTLAGVTVLRFDAAGQVIDHRDYWNQVERKETPYPGW
jgi:ketosteroid isomerase-like protein